MMARLVGAADDSESMAALRRYRRLNVLRHRELVGESEGAAERRDWSRTFWVWYVLAAGLLFAGASTHFALLSLLGGLALVVGVIFGVVWGLRRRGLLRPPQVGSPASRAFMRGLEGELRRAGASDASLEEESELGPTVDFLNRYWRGPAPTLALDRLGLGLERRHRLEAVINGVHVLVLLIDGAARSAPSPFLRHPRVPHLVVLVAGVTDSSALPATPPEYSLRSNVAGVVVSRRLDSGHGSAGALARYIAELAEFLGDTPAHERSRVAIETGPGDPKVAGSRFLDALWGNDGGAALGLVDPELGLDLDWELTPETLLAWFESREFRPKRWEWHRSESSLAGISVRKRVDVTLERPGRGEQVEALELQLRRRDGGYRVGFIRSATAGWRLGVEWDHDA